MLTASFFLKLSMCMWLSRPDKAFGGTLYPMKSPRLSTTEARSRFISSNQTTLTFVSHSSCFKASWKEWKGFQTIQSGLFRHGIFAITIACQMFQYHVSNVLIFVWHHVSQLSNLWRMPNTVSKGFDTAMKTGFARQFKWYPITHMWVSSRLPITVD